MNLDCANLYVILYLLCALFDKPLAVKKKKEYERTSVYSPDLVSIIYLFPCTIMYFYVEAAIIVEN